jgi:uncharacterized circularly permuted ATP-grasp superfamily protein
MTVEQNHALFQSYPFDHPHFDEMFGRDGVPRPHYDELYDRLLHYRLEELHYRQQASDLNFLNQGITFTVYGDEQGTERTFPFDLLPRIITHKEWQTVETGLTQRIIALDLPR